MGSLVAYTTGKVRGEIEIAEAEVRAVRVGVVLLVQALAPPPAITRPPPEFAFTESRHQSSGGYVWRCKCGI